MKRPLALQPLPLFTPADVEKALTLAASGISLAGIRTAFAVPPKVWRLIITDPEFRAQLDVCRKIALEELSDRLLRVHRWKDKAAAKIYSQNLQFLLERRIPEVYGRQEKLTIDVDVDLRVALDRGRARVAALEDSSEADELCS